MEGEMLCVNSMWNEVNMGDVDSCVESTFTLPLQLLLFYNKVYTVFWHNFFSTFTITKNNNMTFLVVTQTELFLYQAFYVFLCIALVISFILRDTPLGFLWHIFKWLIIGMLISFGIDFVKKGAKDWWNK